jgi:hypothetical protein
MTLVENAMIRPPLETCWAAWLRTRNVPRRLVDYFRRLVRHQKLDERFGNELVDHIIAYVKS